MKKEEIRSYIKENGGITLNKRGDLFIKNKGFVVSVFGKEYQTNDLEKAVNKLLEYSKEGLMCGVWLDSDIYYVDVNEYYTEQEEAELVGLDNKQLAIFDLEKCESIKLIENDFILYEYDKELDDLVAIGSYDTLKELARVNNITYKHASNYLIDNFKFNMNNLKNYNLIKDKYIIIKY